MTFQGSFQAEAVLWCLCLEELSMYCLCCIRAVPHPVQWWQHWDPPPCLVQQCACPVTPPREYSSDFEVQKLIKKNK